MGTRPRPPAGGAETGQAFPPPRSKRHYGRSAVAFLTEGDIADEVFYDRPYRFTWTRPPFMPPLEETKQAYGICFTTEGDIVLVTHGDD